VTGHAGRAHAVLSASGAHRWLVCTPSARLEAELPDSTSQYAEEGTLAHELAEALLRRCLDEISPEEFDRFVQEVSKDPRYSGEMLEHVQRYVDVAMERINEARARNADALVLVEQRLDFSRWVPDGFGTGDCVIVADDTLEVVDLKYGQGVPVQAAGNPQIRLYALGALDTYGALFDIERVRMTIVQPRLDSVTTDEITAAELLDWAETVVRPAAEKAAAGEGEPVPGEHCRFCKVKATCRARAEYNLELARYEFAPPELLTDEEIAEVLARAEELQRWVADIQEYALQQALNGNPPPGWKLVEGRSTRRYTDETAIYNALVDAGYDPDDIAPRTLLSVSKLEKRLGRKTFEELVGKWVDKPPGKPTLVPESDKRPALSGIEAARRDFQDN
jgi:hypothetical protein